MTKPNDNLPDGDMLADHINIQNNQSPFQPSSYQQQQQPYQQQPYQPYQPQNNPAPVIIIQNNNTNNNYETTNDNLQVSKGPKNAIEALNEPTLQAKARLNFIKKVYGILMIQLLVTIGICFLSYSVQSVFQFQLDNYWLFYVFFGISIGLMIAIYCCECARRHPTNLLLLMAFTLCFSYIVSFTTSVYAQAYGGLLVIQAMIITMGVVGALTLYAMLTRTDFTSFYGVIIIICIAFFFFGIMIPWQTETPILYKFYCTIGVIIAGVLLLVDTQMIVGGDREIKVSLDDYVLGALMLYVDIIRMFLCILRLMGGGSGS